MFRKLLEGPGELKSLLRTKDWSQTAVGEMHTWPQSLLSTLSIILNTKFPMFLWWGPEKTQFYNDAYRPSMGNEGKHPLALGQQGKDCWPEIWDVINPLMDHVLTTGEATWSANQLIPIYRNGQLEDVYWTFSYSPVYDEAGKSNGILVVCTETTQEIQNLKAVKEAKEDLEFTIEAAELGAWDLDPYTMKFKGNKRLKSWFGMEDQEEDIELSIALKAIVEADRERVQNAIDAALDPVSDGHLNIDYSIAHLKTGQQRIVRVKGKALFSASGQASRFSGIMQDITEECLRQKQKDDFIGIASHELKTPLTSLKSSVQLMERMVTMSNEHQALGKFVAQSMKSVNKVGYLVEDLLNVTKLTGGHLSLNKEEIVLAELIHECCQHTRFEGTHPIMIEGDLKLKVSVDVHRIDQVLTNFINNAVKYDPHSKEIYIVIKRLDDQVKVCVTDHGPGIPPEKIPYLFDRYYRADDDAIMYSGLGLGLYISAEIIKRHKGEIGVNSELGKGSTFWFSLPLGT
jgi:signal transduction histidine kinase